MKNAVKKFSVMALCVVMLIMSIVPAFAANGSIEDHSIIDCTNRYKMDDYYYNFTIKLPKGTDLYDVQIEITKDYNGTRQFYDHLFYFSVPGIYGSTLTLKESYGGSDYYELITHSFSGDGGVGIKLFMHYNGISYMATDTANGSTTEGHGYWLGP